MEHILQFAIGIDEDRIKNVAEGLVRSPKFREKVLNKMEDKNND